MTEMAVRRSFLQDKFLRKPYRVHALLYVLYIIYGLLWNTLSGYGFRDIIDGMLIILMSSDILVTDYIYIAGLGAALINVGIMGLLAIWVLVATRHRPFGLDMGVLGLVTGFAFFGKNPLNMLPILIGAYLFSRAIKRPFEENVLPALLGNALAPAVSVLAHVDYIPTELGIVLGILVGIFIGFTISPLSVWMRKAHEGFNLYNVGFTAGIMALSLMALYRNLGIEFEPRNLWSSGNNTALMIFLAMVSLYYILIGLLTDTGEKVTLKELLILKFEDFEDFDYFRHFWEKSYIAMGILGLACMGFMQAMQAQYTGLAMGAILSIIGFGAFGKSLLHGIPIVAGALLADFANFMSFGTDMNENNSLVAILFSTCLTPISKAFGWKWGVMAGFMHLSLATNISMFHGGMNLYNNGLAGGLVAMILLPIIRTFSRRKSRI